MLKIPKAKHRGSYLSLNLRRTDCVDAAQPQGAAFSETLFP